MATDTPEGLRPYEFHGLDLQSERNGKEAMCECPWCGRGKFSIDIKSSQWRCLVCDESGNQYTFLRKLWEQSSQDSVPVKHLASDRGLLPKTLEAWGIKVSLITREFIVPGYNAKGELTQLYRYVPVQGKRRLLATPTISQALHGVNLYDAAKQVVYLCEGPWDAMKLWEVLGTTRELRGKFVRTKHPKLNMLHGANVLAVPGCSTFQASWKDVFLKKRVYVVYDNDHPRKHPKTGKVVAPAAYSGVEKVAGVIGAKAKEVNFLRWGKDGYDLSLAHGMDVRDLLNGSGSFLSLSSRFAPVPKEWLRGKSRITKSKDINPKDCSKWLQVSNQWRKALKWGRGLDVTLSVMLASVVSTDLLGDQLWIKVVAPASAGKSTLCEAISVNKQYVLAKSTIRGFHSGFKSDSSGEEDNSLIVKAAGKTLVTKDGDTLLQSPNLGQILSEARDIYDKTSRTHYRNKMGKEYTGINMTWLLCGTSSLRSIDSSELGERFLDCVIMDGIDDEMEDDILMRVAEREDKNLSSGDDAPDTGHDKDLTLAMELTGGYVGYLRKNAKALMARVETPRDYLQLITRIGKFVAFMRARPSTKQAENAERELGARLVSQHLRLAKCLTVVLNKDKVDKEVMERVVKVALDTARGVTLDICNLLWEEFYEHGAEKTTLSLRTSQSEYTTEKLLMFLKQIGVVELNSKKIKGIRERRRWRLTGKMIKLFNEVLAWENKDDE